MCRHSLSEAVAVPLVHSISEQPSLLTSIDLQQHYIDQTSCPVDRSASCGRKLEMARMAMSKFMTSLLLVTLMIGSSYAGKDQGGGGRGPRIPPLQTNFYKLACPNAEAIVYAEMSKIFNTVPVDPLIDFGTNVAPDLLRLHFHDCFVQVG